ncbi:uncharacterized protein METZ01_LOCUS46339 [marine metagenome]|uniref:Transglycosylase SLT domain-containing protein n=1 Tax=marine metagenome TaxID=408172 RepID=A0A381RNM8_9ZZZZ
MAVLFTSAAVYCSGSVERLAQGATLPGVVAGYRTRVFVPPRPVPGVLTLLVSLFTLFAAPRPALAGNEDIQLPEARYPAAVRLYRSNAPAAALAQLNRAVGDTTSLPTEALVLRATLLGAAGRGREAETVWRRVFDRAVWMRTFSRRALVTSMAERGEPALAEPILDELIDSDATRHLDLLLLVANAYLERREFGQAITLYRQALRQQGRNSGADQARLGLAVAQEEAGDAVAAVATLRDAQLEHRTGNGYATALAREQQLNARLGRDRAPFAPAQYRTLSRRLRNYSRYSEAAAVLEEWRGVQPDAEERIDFELIGVLYDSRANDEAIALIDRFTTRHASSALLADVRLTRFRLAVRTGDTARARTLGLELFNGEVRDATPSQRLSAGELLAAYLVAVGDLEGGLDLYRQLFQRATGPDMQRMMLWKAGVAALRAGQHERALTNLRALNDRRPTGDLRPAGLYWQAVAEIQVGQIDQAARKLRALVQTQPYHYYGLQARGRLVELHGEEAVPTPPTREFPALSVGSVAEQRAEFSIAMVLARAGLPEDAAWYLRRLLDQRRSDRGLALLAARASAAAGDHAAVSRIMVNHFAAFLQRPAEKIPADFYALVYPRPFLEAIMRAARAQNIDSAFMYSLMRQESRFDPAARSLVGALGLFQIMPYTALELGPRSGIRESAPDFRDEDFLLQPPINAAIAATLAGDLFTLFGGALAPVIASYNAGEARVAIWWKSARNLSEDFFVDTIPYSETRRFAREVLANVAAYQRVYHELDTAR